MGVLAFRLLALGRGAGKAWVMNSAVRRMGSCMV